MNAPGQSESPASPHHADLAVPWSKGENVPLVFSDEAVRDQTIATLTLTPRARAAR
jgi:penicillin amidase